MLVCKPDRLYLSVPHTADTAVARKMLSYTYTTMVQASGIAVGKAYAILPSSPYV